MSEHYKLPEFPDIIKEEDVLESFWGTHDPDKINEAAIQNMLDLKEINAQLLKVDRKKVKLELLYKHKYREIYLSQSSDKNETWKKHKTEMECEKEEIKLTYYEELSKELNRKAQEIRARLETLKNISYNVREEMRL